MLIGAPGYALDHAPRPVVCFLEKRMSARDFIRSIGGRGFRCCWLQLLPETLHAVEFRCLAASEDPCLAPADGCAAFESRNVDAWVIWDPFQAAAEKATVAPLQGLAVDVVERALSRYEFNVEPIKVSEAVVSGQDWS